MTDFRIAEAATLLGISDDTLRRWIDAGRAPGGADAAGRRTIAGVDLARLAEEVAAAAGGAGGAVDVEVVGQSVRNRFVGLVTKVTKDTVMAQVEIQAGPHRLVSLISREAVDHLGLEPGVLAVAAVKSTSVSVDVVRAR